ncbi:hypothetical protein G6F68_021544 [Rhizopus microsporus]|nr:hypothetical protein G6F68_021544 [Rhizopus microsporus]
MSTQGTRVAIVIPSRYASNRLPGKPLADIAGKPMVQHVHERASEVAYAHFVVVATDDERVANAPPIRNGSAWRSHAVGACGHLCKPAR